jgi:hypothetical protein
MGTCLVQQLFRQKIGRELDQEVIDALIFPLLRSHLHINSRNLMVDIRLMKPNAITIKGSIFEVADESLDYWRHCDAGLAGEDYPQWFINPLSVSNISGMYSGADYDLDSTRSASHSAHVPGWQDDTDFDVTFAPNRATRVMRINHKDGEPIRIGNERMFHLDPITWNIVDILNRLRGIDNPEVRMDGIIVLNKISDHDKRLDALERLDYLGYARDVTDVTYASKLRQTMNEMMQENIEYVNKFLEDAVVNEEVIYWNELQQWSGESLILSKS